MIIWDVRHAAMWSKEYMFCIQNGWEPFAAVRHDGEHYIYFRKPTES